MDILTDRNKTINVLILSAGGFVMWKFLVKPALDKQRREKIQEMAQSDPTVAQAMQLQAAMNPSGLTWLHAMDGTDEEAIRNVAKAITDLKSVQDAYFKITNRALLDDLRNEMSTTGYNGFMNQIAANPKTEKQTGTDGKVTQQQIAPAVSYVQDGYLVVAKKKLNFRDSPDATYTGGASDILDIGSNNISMVYPAGNFVGYTTGKSAFDSKNNVKFIQVAFKVDGKHSACPALWKLRDKQVVTGWVSASSELIDTFRYYAEVFKAYPKIQSSKATGWMVPPQAALKR
jgi:hypothetical protein